MVRRLAEATKARRTRRTRGEGGVRFFLFLLEEAAPLPLAGARLAEVLLAGVLVVDGLFVVDAVVEALGADVVLSGEDDWDWATAGGKKPSQSREKIPANTTTAIRRTQTLLTAENWHP
jgi:hypothetical protein